MSVNYVVEKHLNKETEEITYKVKYITNSSFTAKRSAFIVKSDSVKRFPTVNVLEDGTLEIIEDEVKKTTDDADKLKKQEEKDAAKAVKKKFKQMKTDIDNLNNLNQAKDILKDMFKMLKYLSKEL